MAKIDICDGCGKTGRIYSLCIDIRRMGSAAVTKRRKVGDYCMPCATQKYPVLNRRSMTGNKRRSNKASTS